MSTVRIRTVNRVTIEHVRCTCLKLGFHNPFHDVDSRHRNAGQSRVIYRFLIFFTEQPFTYFLVIEIFKAKRTAVFILPAHRLLHFVRAE
ncbi:hypothetical protein D3C78_1104240 [compost metagenome]